MRARRLMSWRRSSWPRAPAPMPITDEATSGRKRGDVGLEIWCPDELQDDVVGATGGDLGRVDGDGTQILDCTSQLRRTDARYDRRSRKDP